MLSKDTVLQNRYRIVRPLGKGGMGTIYEAVDERVRAVVAIKEAGAGGDETARREFEREAGLLANLQHQALPKVMDYFTEDGGEYLVMEYIPGFDLAQLLERRGAPFHPNLVLRWADELLDLLEYLHGLRPAILHRDIKPSNLKLTQREDIYLLDFGLAKGSTGKMTTNMDSRSVRGYTPVYAPLEQILGQGTDARSDLYSLGATLYHLFTGRPPADAPARDEQLEEGNPDPLIPIQTLNPGVPPAVADVIHQALSVRRRYRPESAAAMRGALKLARDEAARSPRAASVVTQKAGPPKAPVTQPLAAGYPQQPFQPGQQSYAPQNVQAPARSSRRGMAVLAAVAVLAVLAAVITVAVVRRRAARRDRQEQAMPTQTPSPAPKNQTLTENIDGVELEIVLVPGGNFQMGTSGREVNEVLEEAKRYSPEAEVEWILYETPQHSVTVPTFYMGKFEVTRAQWRAVARLPVMNRYINIDPSDEGGDNLPVVNVNWEDAVEFCERLSKKTGKRYRLPSESEWEYACRAGTTTQFAFGQSLSAEQANFDGDYPYGGAPTGVDRGQPTPVGSFKPNDFGLYDMHGNVWEWCLDYRHHDYVGAPADGSAWETSSGIPQRIIRGGSWDYYAYNARSAYRTGIEPYLSGANIGFRVVTTLVPYVSNKKGG